MHKGKVGLYSQSARKEDINRSRTTLTISEDTKRLLSKIGNGSMSDGVYFSAAIIAELLIRKVIRIDFDKGGIVYRIGEDELVSSPRSGVDEARRSHRAEIDKLVPNPKPQRNPYAGRVMDKEQLMATGHFTHAQVRAILPGHRWTGLVTGGDDAIRQKRREFTVGD
ncbi:hypothetical protein PN466_03280 [Roseofilum reptotaenium CS-1145]|uniref:Uncharacterized protein n=1 Tax=Roseofilum reptotaenium AO1-A TaxID=1925591 RepID=A0A1L9QM50_9CYAN|nr:hypothetical protein [Roseofilum reptotaenium]MDB9515982.1 hypothetical protein [Roseofilum reptotaenium CS-1145]OJJ21905.1 hypothetical protein BI308_20090 [Roseofilum reptotaenium AO1-A]